MAPLEPNDPAGLEAAEQRAVRRRLRTYVLVGVALAAMIVFIGWRWKAEIDRPAPHSPPTGQGR